MFTFCGIDCLTGSTICFGGKSNLSAITLGDTSSCDRFLLELERIMCGFSLTQEHKNSLENDRSFELKIEDPLESDEHELIVVGEGGDGEILFDTGMTILGVFGGMASPSTTWI